MLPPRINQALDLNLKSFVLHDFCQQFARDVFNGRTALRSKTNTGSTRHQLLQTLGFPLFSLCHVLKKLGIGGPLRLCHDFDPTIPRNRLGSHAASYFFFLILILVNILNPDDDPDKLDWNWYNYLMPFFTLGFLFIDIEKVQNSILITFRKLS